MDFRDVNLYMNMCCCRMHFLRINDMTECIDYSCRVLG